MVHIPLPPPTPPIFHPMGLYHPLYNPSTAEVQTLLKIMPTFNGKVNDSFDSWVLGTKSALKYGPNCTEKQKLDAVIIKISGDAREMVNSSGEIRTVESLFVEMRRTYGRDKRAILANARQKADETVKMFSMRLRTTMQNLGWMENSDDENPVILEYFIAGLRPDMSDRVKGLFPINLNFAEKYAIQMEVSKPAKTDKKGSYITLD